MKMTTLKKTLIALFLISSFTINAQGGVDETEDAPIDTNISILLVSGILLGAVLITRKKKANSL